MIKAVFQNESACDIACFLIVPGEPDAISIRSPGWGLTVTRSGIQMTHGNMPPETFDRLEIGLGEAGVIQIDNRDAVYVSKEAPDFG